MATERYYCPVNDCEQEEYVYRCFAGLDPKPELGVLVDVQGNPTNRWEDGTAGVPEDIKGWIAMDDCAPDCPIHSVETEWKEG